MVETSQNSGGSHPNVHKRHKKQNNTGVLVYFAVALFAVLGYTAGYYHYQIEAAIGPVFGYKAHSGTIDLTSLQETYNALASNYDGKLDVDKLIEGANSGLVSAAGDAYTVYMSSDESKKYLDDLAGKIGAGIGAQIGIRNGKVTILKVLDDNAAKEAGLLANDVILQINGQSTEGMTSDKAVSLIKGDAGTTVRLDIGRGDTEKNFVITRATINDPSVETSVVGKIGVLTITRFDDATGSLARIAAQSFIKQNVKAVILDLRDNGGGFVTAAKDVAGLWLDRKVMVIEKSGSIVVDTLYTARDAILNNMPTIVLVNGSSASASEIVAGALQEYKVAEVVGEKTFGKGSVQQLVPLSGGAQLKVTIAKWYTPNNKNISQEGITPDTVVGLTQADFDSGLDPQMDKAIQLLN